MLKKLLVVFLVAFMMVSSFSGISAATDEQSSETEYEISKSKTATNLDENFESKVTLSLPAGQSDLNTDIVFVLDASSCGKQTAAEFSNLIDELYAAKTATGAKVQVGAVLYRGTNQSIELQDLTEDYVQTLKDRVTAGPNNTAADKGGNAEGALLAADAMLTASSTKPERKFVVFVSDGIMYSWDEEGVHSSIGYWDGNYIGVETANHAMYASNSAYEVWHPADGRLAFKPTTTWEQYLTETVAEQIAATVNSGYVGPFTRDTKIIYENHYYVPSDKMSYEAGYACCVDVALAEALKQFKAMNEKYTIYVRPLSSSQYGYSFMQELGQISGKSINNYSGITREIFYLVDAGSVVVDKMGYGTDDKGNDYDMNFVDDAAKLQLTVGSETYAVTKIETAEGDTSTYAFGTANNEGVYPFVLHYLANGGSFTVNGSQITSSDECFKWDINVAIEVANPVQLTYTVVLANPQEATVDDVTYGEYDADGSQNKAALYTNKEATLYPVNTDGKAGNPEKFPMPTVSYTVKGESVDITVTKVWNDKDDAQGIRDSYGVTLYANGEPYGDEVILSAEELEYTWKKLPVKLNGKEIEYTVVETTVPEGYTSEVEGFVITNTHVCTWRVRVFYWDYNNGDPVELSEVVEFEDILDGTETDTIEGFLEAIGKTFEGYDFMQLTTEDDLIDEYPEKVEMSFYIDVYYTKVIPPVEKPETGDQMILAVTVMSASLSALVMAVALKKKYELEA